MGTKRKEGKLDWINEDALAIIELANTDEPGTSNVKFKDAEFTIFTQLNETTGTHTIKVTGSFKKHDISFTNSVWLLAVTSEVAGSITSEWFDKDACEVNTNQKYNLHTETFTIVAEVVDYLS
jgi:hypothetical protein